MLRRGHRKVFALFAVVSLLALIVLKAPENPFRRPTAYFEVGNDLSWKSPPVSFGRLVDSVSALSDKDLVDSLDKVLNLAHFDVSGKQKILSNFVLAENFSSLVEEPACVAVQISLNHIEKLLQFINHWPGPISLALYTPGHDFYFGIIFIRFLRRCFAPIRKQVTWHMSFPSDLSPNATSISLLRVEFDCTSSMEDLRKLFLRVPITESEARKKKKLKYPQNMLRNTARANCPNPWITCPDVDMVFPLDTKNEPSMYQRLSAFLRQPEAENCSKCAFVFPLYEVQSANHTVPKNKQELLQLKAENLARQYHIKVFRPNQHYSKLEKWEARGLTSEVKVAFPVKYKIWYEPVYIAKRGTPPFDERYQGYGMTRNTQVLEMALEGYRFFLLDTIFLSHLWGLQVKNKADKRRTWQTRRNHKIFCEEHARELAVRFNTDKYNLLKMQHRFKKDFSVIISSKNDNKMPELTNGGADDPTLDYPLEILQIDETS